MSSPPMTVEVKPQYLADQSSPEDGVYTFAYTVTVSNVADFAVQLISRHWLIHDGTLPPQEVKGLGVIGQQPLLEPGASFRYTSGCRLRTPSGTMHGSYFVVSETGDRFDVPIPMFALEADGVPGASGPLGSGGAGRVLH